MKKYILRSAMLLGLCTVLGTAACSESKTDENTDGKKLTAITLTPSTATLLTGETATLTATATPAEISLDALRWSSSDNSIASVDENGKVTAAAVGKATINAAYMGIKGSCEITVSKRPVALQKIVVSPSVASLKMGNTITLTATLVPADADVEGPIIWSSSKPQFASIDATGKVTAVGNGQTELIATIGSISGKCNLEIYSQTSARAFTFYQLNIWEGLMNITGSKTAGKKAFIDQLVELKPDVASFCEFPGDSWADEILSEAITALKERTGIQYYYNKRSGSGTRGLLTRHPILSTDGVPSINNGNNLWFYRTVIDFYGQQMAIYASHAYHSYYACYLPRGYGDGSNNAQMGINGWLKLAGGPITDVNFILKQEELSGRTQIATDLVADMAAQRNQGRLTIFGGDLNQPSHLDWTEATKNNYEHAGCVVPWPISTICYAGGIKDAFREIYPNPVTHPGVTWPVSNKDATKDTQWAAEADERDRIDFIYYYPDEKLAPTKAQIVGPSAMISKSQIVEDTFVNKAEELIPPTNNLWPTDHRGLFVTFDVQFPS